MRLTSGIAEWIAQRLNDPAIELLALLGRQRGSSAFILSSACCIASAREYLLPDSDVRILSATRVSAHRESLAIFSA